MKHIAEINTPYPEERISFSGKSLFLAKARKTELQILSHSTGISVVSSALKKHFEEKYPIAGERIHVVPNAVNPENLNLSHNKAEELRNEYRIENEVVVGFVGSIFPYHGVDILIEAFAKLPVEARVRLLIVGDGAILPDLKALARRLGVFEKIIFTGGIPHREIYPHVEIMDIATMPKTNWYCSPVKIFEYGLCAKAVIAPDTASVRDVMSDNEAILVKPNIAEFHSALVDLIENPEKRKRLGKNWNVKVLENYTWDDAARNTLKLCT